MKTPPTTVKSAGLVTRGKLVEITGAFRQVKMTCRLKDGRGK